MAKDFNRDEGNALVRQVMNDPVLALKFWDNQKKMAGDQRAMEDWARDGFTSSGARNHVLNDEDLV